MLACVFNNFVFLNVIYFQSLNLNFFYLKSFFSMFNNSKIYKNYFIFNFFFFKKIWNNYKTEIYIFSYTNTLTKLHKKYNLFTSNSFTLYNFNITNFVIFFNKNNINSISKSKFFIIESKINNFFNFFNLLITVFKKNNFFNLFLIYYFNRHFSIFNFKNYFFLYSNFSNCMPYSSRFQLMSLRSSSKISLLPFNRRI